MTEESKIEVPNFEATSDGKKIFTPKQWLERFRQYAKRKHKMDITELIRGAEMKQTGWTGKEAEIQEDFIWGIGPEALYQMTRAEYKTEPDRIAVKDLIRLFNEYFLPKRNTYHNRGEFFWTKQTESETPEDFWRRLIEIKKECAFEGITAEDLLISKFMTAIMDTKLRDKLMKEKKLELKKTIEMIKQNTYERKSEKHHTGSFDIKPRKRNKRRTNTKNGKIGHKTEKQIYKRKTLQILQRTELESNSKMSGIRKTLQ